MRCILAPLARVWLASCVGVALLACGSSQPPGKCPTLGDWQVPTLLALDDRYEADLDGLLTATEKPSIWLGFDQPATGRMTLTSRVADPRPASASHARDPDRPFDIAVVLYDNNFKELARIDEQDGGIRKRKQRFQELAAGRYYVHLYLQNGLERAGFELALAASAPSSQAGRQPSGNGSDGSGSTPGSTSGSTSESPVAAPRPGPTPGPSPTPPSPPPGGGTTTPPAPPGPGPGTGPTPAPTPAPSVVARVIQTRKNPGGTTIVINRGRKHNIARDWTGRVLDSNGTPVGQTFTLLKVKKVSVEAKVDITADQLRTYRDERGRIRVRLTPPAAP